MGGHHSAYHRELCPGVLRGHEDCFWLCVWGGPPWPGGCLADTASELPGQQLLLHRQKGRWAAKHGAGGARRQEKSCRSTLARAESGVRGRCPPAVAPQLGVGSFPPGIASLAGRPWRPLLLDWSTREARLEQGQGPQGVTVPFLKAPWEQTAGKRLTGWGG